MDNPQQQFHVTVPDEAWWAPDADEEDREQGLDGRERLVTTLVVNGLLMHLEAWEVAGRDDNGRWDYQTTKVYRDDFDHLYNAVSADGTFETTKIAGREYVLLASPYCD